MLDSVRHLSILVGVSTCNRRIDLLKADNSLYWLNGTQVRNDLQTSNVASVTKFKFLYENTVCRKELDSIHVSLFNVIVMAISNTRQFGLLLWKNWLLQKRQIALTFFQVLLPPLFSLILLAIRTQVESTFISTPTIWNSTLADTALPPNLLIPIQIPPPARYWQLAYTPNDTQAALRIVSETAKLLNNETIQNPLLKGVIIGSGEYVDYAIFCYVWHYILQGISHILLRADIIWNCDSVWKSDVKLQYIYTWILSHARWSLYLTRFRHHAFCLILRPTFGLTNIAISYKTWYTSINTVYYFVVSV